MTNLKKIITKSLNLKQSHKSRNFQESLKKPYKPHKSPKNLSILCVIF